MDRPESTGAKAALTLNGQPARATVTDGYLVFGDLPVTQSVHIEPECPFPVTPNAAVARLAQGARRAIRFTVKNTLPQSITGTLDFELPAGVTVEPAAPQFGPLAPGVTAQVPITCIAVKMRHKVSGSSPTVSGIGPRTPHRRPAPRPCLSTSW